MSSTRLFIWCEGALVEVAESEQAEYPITVADSLLISAGSAFALELHRERFRSSVNAVCGGLGEQSPDDFDAFWNAAFRMIPPQGDWFPRVEFRLSAPHAPIALRIRAAPSRQSAVTLLTHRGPDPRETPSMKGPDLGSLGALQLAAKARGADDVVILTSEGYIVDCATNALVWWRGDTLCAPPSASEDWAFARVESVTAKSLFALAGALGVETRSERATPEDLNGLEVWALNALHGIRIVTAWMNGPKLAEKPGRIDAWRKRRQVLRVQIGDLGK